MYPMRVIVGPDGRVAIPGTRAGQIVPILDEPMRVSAATPDPLSVEEQERIRKLLVKGGQRMRQKASPRSLTLARGEWLYGPDGLPR